DSFAERRWQRWRRIRRRAALRRAQLSEMEARAFVGGYLTRAIADEHVREAGAEFVETAAPEEKRQGRGARRAAKMRERVREWSRARKGTEPKGDSKGACDALEVDEGVA